MAIYYVILCATLLIKSSIAERKEAMQFSAIEILEVLNVGLSVVATSLGFCLIHAIIWCLVDSIIQTTVLSLLFAFVRFD